MKCSRRRRYSMPRHNADVRLRHMLDAAREGVQMAQGKTRADKEADMGHPQLLDVVTLWQSLPPEALPLTDERYTLPTGLEVGTVGTGVEAYPRDAAPSACLVECSDAYGCGYAFATIPVAALL